MSEPTEPREVEMVDVEGKGEDSKIETNPKEEMKGQVTNGHIASTVIATETTMTKTGESTNELVLSVERDDSSSPPTGDEKASPANEQSNATSPEDQDNPVVNGSTSITASESIRLDKEVARLKELLSDVSPKAAQQVLRDEWRKFFFLGRYDEDHISFVLRAGLKNANTNVLYRVLKDDTIFKNPLLNAAIRTPQFFARQDIVEKVLQNVNASQILAQVPESTLNTVLAEYVKNVDAYELAKWLAEGERLGFKLDDRVVLVEGVETVIPNQPSSYPVANPTPNHSNQKLASSDRDPLLEQQERNLEIQRREDEAKRLRLLEEKRINSENQKKRATETRKQATMKVVEEQRQSQATAAGRDTISKSRGPELIKQAPPGPWTCPDCKKPLPTFSGYTYHVNKKSCQKQRPEGTASSRYWCQNCLTGFTQSVGMNYHKNHKVCEGGEMAPATSPSHQVQEPKASQDTYPRPMAPPRPDVIVPLQRPQMHTQLPPSYPAVILPPQPVKIQRPPLSTPSYSTPSKVQDPDIRHAPSELSRESQAALEAELQRVTEAYEKGMAAIPEEWSQMDKDARIFSLKNQWSTKKSQIRKKFGVSLRMREKEKEARRAAGIPNPSRPKHLDDFRRLNSSSPSFSPISTPPPTEGTNGGGKTRPPNPPPSQPLDFHGFGILRPNKTDMSPYPTTNQYNKRSRSEELEPQSRDYHPYYSSQLQQPTSGLAMVQMNSEDAQAKFVKRYGLNMSGQAKSSSEPKSARLSNGMVTKENMIDLVDSDSSSDGEIPAVARKVLERKPE